MVSLMRYSPQYLVDYLKASGRLNNPLYERAFMAVPRHVFLPDISPERAYRDEAIITKLDPQGFAVSSSSQPSMMIQMFDQMGLAPGHNVLEVGTGTGYNAAVMREIVGENGKVTSVEIDADIARQAEINLHRAGYGSVTVVNADGAAGYAPRAAYDRIICTAGIWDVPAAWIRQLKPNGILVTPIQLDGFQVCAAFVKQADGTLYSAVNVPCRFVYMRGVSAGPALTRRVGSADLRLIGANLDQLDFAALHVLLSSDQERCQLSHVIRDEDFWLRFVPYAVLHPSEGFTSAVFHIDDGRKAYGMEGVGLAFFSPGSASFLPYGSIGMTYCFAGADAFIEMDNVVIAWANAGKPGIDRLRLRLTPIHQPTPEPGDGMVYSRHDHHLHAWYDLDAEAQADA